MSNTPPIRDPWDALVMPTLAAYPALLAAKQFPPSDPGPIRPDHNEGCNTFPDPKD